MLSDEVHIIGLQETRQPAGTTGGADSGCILISSGARGGHLGCGLMVNVSSPYAQTRAGPRRLSRAHFHLLSADPRYLFVRVSAPLVDEVIAVAHCPYVSTNHELEQARKSWWTTFQAQCKKWRPTIVLGDFNAHIDSSMEVRPFVGRYGYAQSANDNGMRLRELAMGHALVVENTLTPEACQPTFYSNHGTWHQIDFILLSEQLHKLADAPHMMNDWDAGSAHTDHLPITCDLCGERSRPAGKPQHPRLDQRKLQDPHLFEAFKQDLRSSPPTRWEDDVNVSADQATSEFQKAMFKHFQMDNLTAIRAYISRDTMKLVRVRRQVQASLRRHLRLLDHPFAHLLRAIQKTHEDLMTMDVPWLEHFGPLVWAVEAFREQMINEADLADQISRFLRATAKPLRQRLRKDRTDFLQRNADQLDEAILTRASRTEWQFVRKLLAHGGRGSKTSQAGLLPILPNIHGDVAANKEEIDDAMIRHFASIEAAKVMDMQGMCELYNSRRNDAAAHTPLHDKFVPTLFDLTRSFAKAKTNKAPGPDAIPDDVLKAAPMECALHFLPITTKCALLLQEPAIFKAGVACALWKQKGTGSLWDHYRSILLNNCVGKHFHKWIRGQFVELMHTLLRPTQLGGKPKVSSLMASMLVRTHVAVVNAQGRTAVLQYIDLRSAFYSTIRQIGVTMEHSREDLDDLLESTEIPEQLRPALQAILAAPAILADTTVPEHLCELLSEANRATWFTARRSDDIAVALKGSRPGNGLADFFFNLIYAKPLAIIEEELRELGVVCDYTNAPRFEATMLGEAEVTPTSDATYMDDTVLMTVPHRNEALLHHVVQVAEIAHEVLTSFGFQVNYDKGKTGVSISLAGKGSQDAKLYFYGEPGRTVTLPTWGCKLHVEHQYRHLGSWLAHDGRAGPEIRARTAEHGQALGELRRSLLRFPNAPLSAKVRYVEALANSKLLYHAELWTNVPQRLITHAAAAYTKGYRCAANMQTHELTTEPKSDAEVLLTVHKPDFASVLRIRRLRFWNACLQHGPPALRAALDALRALTTPKRSTTWCSLLEGDLEWLGETSNADYEPQRDFSSWCKLAQEDHHIFANRLTKAWDRHVAWLHDDHHRQVWEASLEALLGQAGLAPSCPQAVSEYICYDCGRTTRTATAMKIHYTRVHNQLDDAQRHAKTAVCEECQVDFRTRPRLIAHLRHRHTGCLRALCERGNPLATDEAKALRDADLEAIALLNRSGYKADKAIAPARRRPGGLRRARERKAAQAESPLEPPPIPPALLPEPPQFLRTLPSPDWSRFEAHLVLHLFSGARRERDFQAVFEELCTTHAFWVMSVDVANSEVMGDLSDSLIVGKWHDMVVAGRVIATLSGPPCDTWSAARWWPLPGARRRPPRPVRRRDLPWGVRNLNARERAQVHSGNVLLRTSLYFAHLAACTNMTMVQEHPAQPDWLPGAASCWLLARVRSLLTLPAVTLHTIDQCMYGAPARKPTSLLRINMPSVATALAAHPSRGRCTHGPAAHQTALGLHPDCTYRTSPLKDYPPGLSRLLGESFLSEWSDRIPARPRDTSTFPEDLLPLFVPTDPYAADIFSRGADYFARPSPVRV